MENQTQTPNQFSLWEGGKRSTPLDLPMALGANCFTVVKRESAIEVVQYVVMQFPEQFRRVALTPSDFFYHLSFNSDIQKVQLVFNGMVALAKACDDHKLQWEDVVKSPAIAREGTVQAFEAFRPTPGRTNGQDFPKSLLERFLQALSRHFFAATLWIRSIL